MSGKIFSIALIGLDGCLVEVEVDVSRGFAEFQIVGLPDKSIQESKQRIILAIKNSGFDSPFKHARKVIVNLAPAWLKKEGTFYDLPIALAYLHAQNYLNCDFKNKIFIGELALNGKVRPVRGIIPACLFAKRKGFREIYVPKENEHEILLIRGIKIYTVGHLRELFDHLTGIKPLAPVKKVSNVAKLKNSLKQVSDEYNFKYIRGQDFAKRGALIAAAGNHHLLFEGPPGVGKTFMARSIVSILPNMDEQEILEVSSLYSLAGLLDETSGIVTERPFRAPHHTSSLVSIIGGGTLLKPGEISLSHRGVLFMDEFNEFPRNIIEALRQPLEDKEVIIARSTGRVKYPANFLLIASLNPCPCGYYNDPEKECVCSLADIERYKRKISGPILDRFDLKVIVERVSFDKMGDFPNTAKDDFNEQDDSLIYKEKIEQARLIQKQRYKGLFFSTNGELNHKYLKKFCPLDQNSKSLLNKLTCKYNFSPRSILKIIKVARTIADLSARDNIIADDILEAVNFKPKDERT